MVMIIQCPTCRAPIRGESVGAAKLKLDAHQDECRPHSGSIFMPKLGENTMSEAFLDTGYVRDQFIRGAYSQREMAKEFDLWLDSVKADAWDEGAEALEHHQMHVSGGWPTNPYRKQEEA